MNGKRRERDGFTLIEMLVALAIIGILAAMVVFMFPGFSERKRAANGASQLQGWLFQAKQKAFRDGAPRGLRLFRDQTNSELVTQCQFTEVPEDYSGGMLTMSGPNEAVISGVEDVRFSADQSMWLVQQGDYLEIQGVGLPHLITNVGFDGALKLTLASPVAYPIAAPGTPQYRIMRSPRVVGDEPLEFPADVAVDLQTNGAYGNPLPGGFPYAGNAVDVLFSPGGKMITPGTRTDFVALWVRDITNADKFAGNPTIIGVHVRSGLIAGHPPADPSDPYLFIRRGNSPD